MVTLISLLLFLVVSHAYRGYPRVIKSTVLCSGAETGEGMAKLKLVISGPSIGNALFRAELKKELTFFRGCAAQFLLKDDESSATLLAEGKRAQLERFLNSWVAVLCSDVTTRKPSFQGPALVIAVQEKEWLAFDGSIGKGFSASKEAPILAGAAIAPAERSMEAKSMTGTDESV